MTLPDEAAIVAREEQAWAALRALVRAEGDPLLGIVAPKLAIAGTGVDTVSRSAGFGALVTTAARARWRPGPMITVVDGIAIITASSGQARALAPVLTALADEHEAVPARLPPVRPSALRSAHVTRRRLTPVLDDWSRTAGTAPIDISSEVFAAALVRARLAEWLDRTEPRRLVVATQHNTTVRAAVREARDRGIPSTYVPHAPAADTPWYRDIPTDAALLRGQGEVDFYTGLGASSQHLAVVGDPSITHPLDRATVHAAAPLVWATSPQPETTLRAIVALLDETGLMIEVAPHPRADRGLLERICPATWCWNRYPSTGTRLAVEPLAAVVQHRSGMGLEAAMRGVPVLELCAPGRSMPYLYLRELACEVRTATDVVAALGALPMADAIEATSLRWCAATGDEAAIATATRLRSDDDVATGPVLDGWLT